MARILVIDDDVMLCRAVKRMLAPHQVVAVHAGADALTEVAAAEFDIILCDIMMPEMSGPEVYQHIEKIRPAQQDRVLFMTGGTLERVNPLLAGIPLRLIEKPFTRAELQSTVNDFLSRFGVPDPGHQS
ncbi:MAG TPA: response regulator [Kofleriaceae bacterium]|jgi:CheY-like chemotaxis protein|nr:response regulator [Kofleriaceae bacterium]